MKYTSSGAAKLLRRLMEAHSALIEKENASESFLASVGEDIESVRPQYNYGETQEKLASIENEIRKVKHAINVFNATHIIPEFDMTIDEMLVFIPQLSNRLRKLGSMRSVLPKSRESGGYRSSSPIIDYRYANYNVADAERDYVETSLLLSKAQLALDTINNTETMEIDISE